MAASFLNFTGRNGGAVLAALGLSRAWGACPIAQARATLLRARSRDLKPFERAGTHVVSAAPMVAEALGAAMLEGVARLAPADHARLREWGPPLTGEALLDRLDRLLAFVEAQLALGATELRWA